MIRLCHDDDFVDMLSVINAAATAYRGVIPDDCYHTPYMQAAELRKEIAAGVTFHACEAEGNIAAIMGIQHVKDVALIRHAYTAPSQQGRGYGTALLKRFQEETGVRLLVGTWEAACWAIRFYQRHGFTFTTPEQKTILLQTYWTVSQRQVESSVVLSTEGSIIDEL